MLVEQETFEVFYSILLHKNPPCKNFKSKICGVECEKNINKEEKVFWKVILEITPLKYHFHREVRVTKVVIKCKGGDTACFK